MCSECAPFGGYSGGYSARCEWYCSAFGALREACEEYLAVATAVYLTASRSYGTLEHTGAEVL